MATATASASLSAFPAGITSSSQCTLETCPLTYAHLTYLPNAAGNGLLLAIFGLLIPAQIYMGIRYRTWGFMAGMFCGLVLEVFGYVGRLKMIDNPFTDKWFAMYIVCLTIAPAFLSAAIYISLARIVAVYTVKLSRFSQRWYGIIFVIWDVVSLLLQAAGGGLATSNDESTLETAKRVMMAGLSTQVISLSIYLGLCIDFAWRIRRLKRTNANSFDNRNLEMTNKQGNTPQQFSSSENLAGNIVLLNPNFAALRASKRWLTFLVLQGLATICIYIRSIFRLAELHGGFRSSLANDQVTFMVLEGAMIVIAALGLSTWGHPGVGFYGKWQVLDYRLFVKKPHTSGV
ncbi:sphingoid long-chain base transporter [Talaromyces proteolyticus]|uniref:Sphingoid long-chain base transporter n=1 Tax=Talaromyces proteolyticus TaxID=1131652 RepID=A0AAD4KR42_9EURO|nr:sphingoid long-chain base transporter [Talaromyces proteolyticus]KAH8697445.1 sphingoid long-chain base transporter [Talaromyces proteolyticus]